MRRRVIGAIHLHAAEVITNHSFTPREPKHTIMGAASGEETYRVPCWSRYGDLVRWLVSLRIEDDAAHKDEEDTSSKAEEETRECW